MEKRIILFPENVINIAAITNDNEKISKENLCENRHKGMVIYNEHEKNMFARIRSHFLLNNNETGAIGLAKYEISRFDIRVRIFHDGLPLDG